MIWGSINLFFFFLSDRPWSAPWINLLHVAMESVIFFFFFHIPKYFILLSSWNLEDLGFSLSQDSYRWPMHQTTSSHELQPQNKYTTYQTKGALFKSPFFLAASSSHTIIPKANYKSFALDSTHYLKCIKLATTTILVKWSTARKGLCCRCNIFHRDSFT